MTSTERLLTPRQKRKALYIEIGGERHLVVSFESVKGGKGVMMQFVFQIQVPFPYRLQCASGEIIKCIIGGKRIGRVAFTGCVTRAVEENQATIQIWGEPILVKRK